MIGKNMIGAFEAFTDPSFDNFLKKIPGEHIETLSASQIWQLYQQQRGKLPAKQISKKKGN